ncbi:uncharacterized protein DUF4224 [Modicisalibacter xianhensis]|uniref:Uncharacterized protein DUF4224 n=1 Tax=Modicisalibacter xianhensis TaxID=442341 RepID=A0A4R8FRE5_9GAMM|nr:DUF4224 domain-containing protein [Halomonas xianhensis]TDX29151.1 uncharacterized protein DUF4224 [Halomonas xianhensis]
MEALFLSPEELEQLTGRRRGKEQRETLDSLGIRWKVNAAGDTLVGRRHVEEVFCGLGAANTERKKPNLGALGR